MPLLEALFHYRMVDVSSLKVLARSWYPDLAPFPKSDTHLALADVHDSIGELRYYREKIFSPSLSVSPA
jgi:oligoribonuclease